MGGKRETLSDDQKRIADELDKINIDQLHKATLSFSNNSQETKKLCVTVEIAVYTLLAGIYKESSLYNLVIALELLGILIPVLFYAVDVFLYYYQDKLRDNMLKIENDIRKRHNISHQDLNKRTIGIRRALFNGSQILYGGLITVSIIAPLLIDFFTKI